MLSDIKTYDFERFQVITDAVEYANEVKDEWELIEIVRESYMEYVAIFKRKERNKPI